MKYLTVLTLAALTASPLASANAQTNAAQVYILKAGSSLETGCFGPCFCPVLSHGMQGTFRLRQTSVDPHITNYEILDFQWILPDATQNRTIVGSGTYRVGGELAAQHQMVLDVSVGGGPVQRFDSGMILGGGTFPEIDIKVSLHGEQACVDTVFHVVAAPGSGTSAELARIVQMK